MRDPLLYVLRTLIWAAWTYRWDFNVAANNFALDTFSKVHHLLLPLCKGLSTLAEKCPAGHLLQKQLSTVFIKAVANHQTQIPNFVLLLH